MLNLGPLIMISSLESIKVAGLMSKDETMYQQTPIFSDHQPGRIASWNTMNCCIYDPLLRGMAPLFIAHMKREDMYSVYLAYKKFEDENLP